MNAVDMEAIAARHPHLIRRPLGQRLALPIAIGLVVVYLIFSWWFFAIGKVLGAADWDIAGAYLADTFSRCAEAHSREARSPGSRKESSWQKPASSNLRTVRALPTT